MSTRPTLPMPRRKARKSKAVPEENVVSDTGSQDLLSALVTFLQPVIRGYAASPASDKASDRNYHDDAQLINGLEGKNLLSALTAFVTVAMRTPPEAHGKQEVPRSELETKTLIVARAHVFNKMPIHLLAFDKTGSRIERIDRNKIFSCILPGVFAKTAGPEFQSAWAEAELLKDSDFRVLSGKFRSNKMKELLEGIVQQSVNYAILSHTWMRDTPGDITFQDWATREDNPRGNTKIVKFCEVAARNHNVTLGWIDTVCINKDSSSELDESIRSMYNWYRGASVCITFLSETANFPDAHRDSWFTRGWTLQELLAPACSVFYNENWNQLGSSSDVIIQSVIQTACGITSRELNLSWSGKIVQIPFSRRMQMACGRQITREEDTSYSLMGILGVDISIAYEKCYRSLQPQLQFEGKSPPIITGILSIPI
ncbi:hypothetical protein HYPSUDRAFT_599342 [Hypholoma sublateritium FD-334 SS-4]|uniref:Heterokaryon incompatibility domain-containing protein n=1 Tax=Hypholoma sublateritium (strain FD-334 SS-4) TaxID=945553 RepID=A0A0D2L7D9_HYPSF|nr:hypothetical protein HYPSUDRAFT_599342 [Hypholoma sublateritium FD-334 SS-4]